jgi:DNA-binding transcriptional MerR regulator
MRSITVSRAHDLPIGKLSFLSGVNIETIRYYERIKMLPAPPRAANGRRVYDPSHLRILGFIRRSRELGFSLDEIRALIRLGCPDKARSARSRHIISKKSGPSSRTCGGLNACSRRPWPNAPARPRRIVRCWIFSMSGGRNELFDFHFSIDGHSCSLAPSDCAPTEIIVYLQILVLSSNCHPAIIQR